MGLHCLPMSHKKDATLIWLRKGKNNNSDLHIQVYQLPLILHALLHIN